jgi:hypothetical protein
MPGLPDTAASGAVSGRAMCRGSLGCRCAMQACGQRAGGCRRPACHSLMSRVAAGGSGPGSAARGDCLHVSAEVSRLREDLEGYIHAWSSMAQAGRFKMHACAPPRAASVECCLQDGVFSGVPAFLGIMARRSHAECTRAGRYPPTCKYRPSCHGMLPLHATTAAIQATNTHACADDGFACGCRRACWPAICQEP